MKGFSDASRADCKGSVTACSHVIQLYGDSIAWTTFKQSRVTLSTYQAEYVAMSKTCQELVVSNCSLRVVLNKHFYPIELFCDNRDAQACALVDGGNKLKRIDEREYYVKQCMGGLC